MTYQKYIDDFHHDVLEPSRYEIKKVLGKGSYGIVFDAVDKFTGQEVAIKKISNVFESVSKSTNILREIKLLRLLSHPNIVRMVSILKPKTKYCFKHVYIVFERMDFNMKKMLKLNYAYLKNDQIQYFMFQLLNGLDALHSARVLHRDIKPQNILINEDCTLKLCDFGLSRFTYDGQKVKDTKRFTSYVQSRWYRAPEICGKRNFTCGKSVDIWSVGCIFGELFTGSPIFQGSRDQLSVIMRTLGNRVVEKYHSPLIKRYSSKEGLETRVKDPDALDLMRKMLDLDPSKRPSAKECLKHRYFTQARRKHGAKYDGVTTIAIDPKEFAFENQAKSVDNTYLFFYKELELQNIG